MPCSSKIDKNHDSPKPLRLWQSSWNYFPNGNPVNPFEKPHKILLKRPLGKDTGTSEESMEVQKPKSVCKSDQLFLQHEDIKHLSRKSKENENDAELAEHSHRTRGKTPEGFIRLTLNQLLQLEQQRIQKLLGIKRCSVSKNSNRSSAAASIPLSQTQNKRTYLPSRPLNSFTLSSRTIIKKSSTTFLQKANSCDKKILQRSSLSAFYGCKTSFKTTKVLTKPRTRQYHNMEPMSFKHSGTKIRSLTKPNDENPKEKGDSISQLECAKTGGIFSKIEYPHMTEIPKNIKKPTAEEMIDRIKILGSPKASSRCVGPAEKIFCQACVKGNVERVVHLLYEGQVNVNDILSQSWSALQHACYNGQSDVVKVLLKLGADPNFKKNNDDIDVIMSAACSPLNEDTGPYECAKSIIQAGVDVNSVQKNGLSPLILAAKRGHKKITRLLLDNGANVDHFDGHHKRTAINWATYRKDDEMVKLLLEYNANPALKNVYGETAYYVAINAGNKPLAELLAFSQTASWRPGLPMEILKATNERCLKMIEYAKTHGSETSDYSIELPTNRTDTKIRTREDRHLKDVMMKLGLQKWIPVMTKHCITYSKFLQLNEKNLIELGVSKMEEISAILDKISTVNADTNILFKIAKNEKVKRVKPVTGVTNYLVRSGNTKCNPKVVSLSRIQDNAIEIFGERPLQKKQYEKLDQVKSEETHENKRTVNQNPTLISLVTCLGLIMAVYTFRKNM